MRIHEITDGPGCIQGVTPDPFKPQADAPKQQQKDLKVKKARLKAQKAQAAVTKAQQS